ncbi:MAG: Type 1 glutamine amidotransferase-like domain-containing protein [Deltaproteobacteria bacterium]|nr:Type 1 glutamine amidotransferase-like domain-containing protein [Deltaproteobacteria bacterium]
MLSSCRRGAAALLFSLLAGLPGCDAGGGSDRTEIAESVEGEVVTLPRLATWTAFRVARRGRVRIKASVRAGDRYTAAVTDHWGWVRGRARPEVTLDVDLRDDRDRSLRGRFHNTSRDDNGTEPDPVPFTAPTSGIVILDVREVDGYAGAFEVRLDVAGAETDAAPPSGVVVHESGDTRTNVSPATTSAVLLAGGGRDHDAATSALVTAGGRGDAVILRMDDTGGAYASYFVERGAHAATEISFDPTGGNDDVRGSALATLRERADAAWIAKKIDDAEILFLAGGNQTKYVEAWRDTRLAGAVGRLVARGAVLGGTSAGMHALAGIVHTPRGEGDSVTSSVALADPYVDECEHQGTRSLGFEPSPFAVPLLSGVVADTHWTQRSRLGRSLVFLARVLTDGARPLGGIELVACDEGVAVVFDASGRGRVFGPPAGGAAWLFRPDTKPDRCVDDRSLDWRAGVPYARVEGTAGGTATIDLTGPVGPARARVVEGVVSTP